MLSVNIYPCPGPQMAEMAKILPLVVQVRGKN